jgi:hypothetical protein
MKLFEIIKDKYYDKFVPDVDNVSVYEYKTYVDVKFKQTRKRFLRIIYDNKQNCQKYDNFHFISSVFGWKRQKMTKIIKYKNYEYFEILIPIEIISEHKQIEFKFVSDNDYFLSSNYFVRNNNGNLNNYLNLSIFYSKNISFGISELLRHMEFYSNFTFSEITDEWSECKKKFFDRFIKDIYY